MKCKTCNKIISGSWYYYFIFWKACQGHPWKVSELETMTSISDEDVIMISDMSEKKTLKINLGELKKYFRK